MFQLSEVFDIHTENVSELLFSDIFLLFVRLNIFRKRRLQNFWIKLVGLRIEVFLAVNYDVLVLQHWGHHDGSWRLDFLAYFILLWNLNSEDFVLLKAGIFLSLGYLNF